MTTFDPTKPVRTRDGRPARIICTDRRQSGFKIIALIGQFEETVVAYTAQGTDAVVHLNSSDGGRGLDLINEPVKHKKWMVIASENPLFHDGLKRTGWAYLYDEKPMDLRHIDGIGMSICACIEIEFEEGQGLE